MQCFRALLAVLLVCAFSMAAFADDSDSGSGYRLFGQTTSYFELNQDEDDSDDDYTKLKQLVSLNIEWSKVTAGVQIEYLDYSDPDLADDLDLDRLREGVEVRKYYLDYATDKLSARLGTFFSSLGRGMTLYVQKNDTLRLDEPIHGAMATATLEHFDLTVLGGTVTEPGQDFEDKVYGGRILVRLPFDFYAGGSYVTGELDRSYPAGMDDVDVWAVEAGGAGVAGLFDVHGEWAEIEKTVSSFYREGHGRYFSVASYFGPVTILGEYKDYFNFSYRYNLPPNAGRANEAYSHDDVKGPRLLITGDIYSIGALLLGSYAEFNSRDANDKQIEWYVGIEETVGRVYIEASHFKRDWQDRKVEETHNLADFHLTVGDRGEVILGYDERAEDGAYFSRSINRTFLTYSISQRGSLSLRHSWEDRAISGLSNRDTFWGAELLWLPNPTMTLTLFGGNDPGGLVCANGQCREEPQFEGFKGTFTWRF